MTANRSTASPLEARDMAVHEEASMGLRPSSIVGQVSGPGAANDGDAVAERLSRYPELPSPADTVRRLEAEVVRAGRYARPLSVLVVSAGAASRDDPRLLSAIASAVRTVDIVGTSSDHGIVVLMPETTGEAALVPARRLLAAARASAPDVKIGLASFPAEAHNADAILAAACAAARMAEPGTIKEKPRAPREWVTDGTTIVARDPSMIRLLETVERLASSDITVLVEGETGAGKELIARALHTWSSRRNAPLVALNCAAVPETLLESELFGYERGAFSGANGAKPGLLESATGGSLFLDEIGECSAGAQAKLLRVLETRRVTRLGSLTARAIDVRIIAATNRALEAEVERGRFREDLYFRLCGASVRVPPLRERRLDVTPLAEVFLAEACARERRAGLRLTPRAMAALEVHAWPGNVRELRNAMACVAATATGPEADVEDFGERTRSGTFGAVKVAAAALPARIGFRPLYEEIRELERTRIAEALEAAHGVRTTAAELIGIPLRTLVTKIKEYDLGDAGRPNKRGPR